MRAPTYSRLPMSVTEPSKATVLGAQAAVPANAPEGASLFALPRSWQAEMPALPATCKRKSL